jgi:acetate kinase
MQQGVRQMIVKRLGWLGAVLDGEANKLNQNPLSAHSSRIFIETIETDEEAVIVRHTTPFCR